MNKEKLNAIITKSIDNKRIVGVVVSLHKDGEGWTASAGNLSTEKQYFIASTTKLYTTAIILLLRSAQKLTLDDKISQYLPDAILKNLHVYHGKDYTHLITIKHLLSNTSGLPDYFEDKNENGKSLLQTITSGNDRSFSFEEAISLSKTMKPKFEPGKKGKAHYSDTNFQLLGKIIEVITGKSMATVYDDFIFKPLNLTKSYLYSNSKDTLPSIFYFKKSPLVIPQAMASFKADGGIVSTAEECMVFLKAFFDGKLFPSTYLPELYQHWNSIMFPLQYGVGIMRFTLPRLFSPFKPIPELIGHSGLSGAFAYYCPDKNAFITGTVNQLHNPSTAYKLMLKIMNSL
jgi:D-alanyl-D-alanine carboxypeptidase